MAILSPTRAQLGGRCYRRHALGNVGTLARKGFHTGAKRSNPAAAFGTVIHAGAAAHWSFVTPGDVGIYRLGSVESAVRAAWDAEFTEATKSYSLEMAQTIMAGYVERAIYSPLVPGNFITIALEERVEVPVGPHTLTFKIDRLLGDGTQDHMVFVDTKTASRLGPQWEQQWDLSLQMKLYKLGVYLKWGKVPDGVIEGVLKKIPTQISYVLLPEWDMPTLEEARDQFLTIANKDTKLLELAAFDDGKIDMDMLWELAATTTEFNDNDCWAYNSPCPFLEVCKLPPQERLALIHTDYETYEPEWY